MTTTGHSDLLSLIAKRVCRAKNAAALDAISHGEQQLLFNLIISEYLNKR